MKNYLNWDRLSGFCIGAASIILFTEHRVAALVLLIFVASVEYQRYIETK